MKPLVSHDVFRERVNLLLSRSGLSYASFARQAGLDRSTLSQLLAGPMPRLPRAETLAAIANAARVSVDWLLGLTNREEVGAEIIESVMQFEPYRESPANDAFLSWMREAQGSRIRTVPSAIPDILKPDEVLKYEYPLARTKGLTAVDAVRQRVDLLSRPHQQLEVTAAQEAFSHFAAGLGRWDGLARETRREGLNHMADLAEKLYPSLRIYLYGSTSSYSAPFTVFGAQRVAVFLGRSYLVLNAAGHIELFASRFDDLVRVALVQPHQVGQYLRGLAEELCEPQVPRARTAVPPVGARSKKALRPD